MNNFKQRKIFFVMAGGGYETDRHYYETIKTKRFVDEFGKFLHQDEADKLRKYSHGRPYAIWGAVPGPNNIRNWESMEEGDYVMVYRKGKIILAAEIALKTRNLQLAEYLWQTDENGKTWELTYFMINEVEVNVEIEKINKYFGYSDIYHPQGFMAIEQTKTNKLLMLYGDLLSLLHKLQNNEVIEKIEVDRSLNLELFNEASDEKIDKAPTEHTEIQWRLIRLGLRAQYDVWVPEGDKNRIWDGNKFSDYVLEKFNETIDVPPCIKNIDTVWKLGYSVKSAFEIENSTQIFSGILRLSDLEISAPHSQYPLFIVAQKEKETRVINQLNRPTFSDKRLGLNKKVKFLSYERVRELDETYRKSNLNFNIELISQ